MEKLSVEILVRIFSFLSARDLCRCSQVRNFDVLNCKHVIFLHCLHVWFGEGQLMKVFAIFTYVSLCFYQFRCVLHGVVLQTIFTCILFDDIILVWLKVYCSSTTAVAIRETDNERINGDRYLTHLTVYVVVLTVEWNVTLWKIVDKLWIIFHSLLP